MKLISYTLVFVQFSTLAYLLTSAPVFAEKTLLLILEIIGITAGVWAVFSVMKQSKLRIQPDVHPDAVLVKNGLYRVVRHPMYMAILITVVPILINYFSIFRLAVFIILTVNLILKIKHEEKLLIKHFPNYYEVHSKTKKLLPFIW